MKTVKTCLLNCSFHGLPFVVDSRFHWSERLFWAVSVVLSWWASLYLMHSSYEQFKHSATSFSVDTSYLDWKTNFPAIVFCEKGNQKYHFYANEWFGRGRNFDTDDLLKDIAFFQGTLETVSKTCNRELNDRVIGSENFTLYADTVWYATVIINQYLVLY